MFYRWHKHAGRWRKARSVERGAKHGQVTDPPPPFKESLTPPTDLCAASPRGPECKAASFHRRSEPPPPTQIMKRQKLPDNTITELAKALGVSKRRTHELLTQGMPTEPQAALVWRQANSGTSDSAERLRQERIQLVRSQRQKIDFENSIRRGEYIATAQVEAESLAVSSQARNEILKLAHDLPSRLCGLDEQRIFKILRDEINETLQRFSDGLAAMIPPAEK
jgi:phage terminase Nu1 subunit (DNA packaging protein)